MIAHRTALCMIPCLLSALALPASEIEIAVAPETVLIVPGDSVQKLNSDFLIRHKEKEPLVIVSVRMTTFDAGDALVTRREINRMGMRPSIEVLGVTEFPPGAVTTILNPFHEFPARMPMAELRYEFTFTPKESEGEIKARAVVRPTAFQPKTALRLPFDGRVLVSDGSDFYAHHRRVDLAHPIIVQMGVRHNPSRHAMDFMIPDAKGITFKNEGKKLDDYYIFGRPILAPAAGMVMECVDGRADNAIGEWTIKSSFRRRTAACWGAIISSWTTATAR